MSTTNSSQSLWDFALEFYAQPQVTETCLHLQDHYRANVCLVIGLYWLDEQRQYLSETNIADLCSYIQDWTQTVVNPLREVRRRLKQPFENYLQDEAQEKLRALIKHAELLAEQKLLMEIECWLARIPANHKPTQSTNLAKYMATLGMEKTTIELIQQKFS